MNTRRPRVLLVTAPYHSGVVEAAGVWLPLALVYVAGAAREAGAEVRIYDAMSLFASHEDIARVIEQNADALFVAPIDEVTKVVRSAKRLVGAK